MCFNRIQSLENLKLKKTKLSPASKIFRALPHSEGFVLAAQVNGEYFYHFAKTRKMLITALASLHILLLKDERKNWKKRKKTNFKKMMLVIVVVMVMMPIEKMLMFCPDKASSF